MRPLPFSQIEEGQPLWVLEVEDPEAAQGHPAELSLRRLSLPGGELLVLALRLFDGPSRPQVHHLAGPLDRPEVAAWAEALQRSGTVRLRLQRAGWNTSFDRAVSAPRQAVETLGQGRSPGRDPEGAIRVYLECYHTELPKLGQPEAVWDLLATGPSKPARKPGSLRWLWITLALLAAGAAAWFLLPR